MIDCREARTETLTGPLSHSGSAPSPESARDLSKQTPVLRRPRRTPQRDARAHVSGLSGKCHGARQRRKAIASWQRHERLLSCSNHARVCERLH